MNEVNQTESRNHSKPEKRLWTIRFLFAAVFSLMISFALAFTDGDLGISHSVLMLMLRITFLLFIVFCVTGFIFGFIEFKHNKRLALIGIIVNFLVLTLVISAIIIITAGINDFHPN